MHDAIKNFHQQFSYEPEIQNQKHLVKKVKFIVAGMGGSHLAAGLLNTGRPALDIMIHRDYGLPALSDEELLSRLVILSSYSGNTEEVIDVFHAAKKKGVAMAAISVGGELLALAKEHDVPFIQLPDTGIQPRSALGYSIKALSKFVQEDVLAELGELASTLHPLDSEKDGKTLAQRLKARVPIIYASAHNAPLAYNWKIKFNETGKIPAFYNVLPELNHNEMTGFDVKDSTKKLAEKFYVILLKDRHDDRRIQKRMDVLQRLYTERGLPIEVVAVQGESAWHAIFSTLVLADWAAYYTAEQYGLESEHVPMVEEFKKLIIA